MKSCQRKRRRFYSYQITPLSTSGVGCQARYLIEGLLRTGKYEFRCLGAAIKHGDYRIINVPPNPSDPDKWEMGEWLIRPIDGFGDRNLMRLLLAQERPDAIFLFTDPRFFMHYFDMEDEIHQICPIAWWHVWDNDPYPTYNKTIYDSIDLCNCHSHKTYGLVSEHYPEITNFIPHAVPPDIFNNLDDSAIVSAKEQILGKDKKDDFVVTWINRNAKRKMPGDVLSAWSIFCNNLEKEYGHRNATLLMHTDPMDQEGPNLYKIVEMYGLERNVTFSTDRIDFGQMNTLHNVGDCYFTIACFPAGQKVMINGGLKNIEDVKSGDLALTHKGRWMPVKKTFSRKLKKENLYTIKSSNNDSITLTGEHPVYVIKKDKIDFLINENLEKFRDMAEWIKASELIEGDYVVWQNNIEESDFLKFHDGKNYFDLKMLLSLDEEKYSFEDDKIYRKWIGHNGSKLQRYIGKRYLSLDEDFAYMLGNWVADGSTNSTFVSFNKKDDLKAQVLLEKYNSVFGNGCIREREKHIQVECSGPGESLYSQLFSSLCGLYSHGKLVPDVILKSPKNIKNAFLAGYVAGDGCSIKNGDSHIIRCRTISDRLMISLKMLLVSLGYCPRIELEDNSHGYGEGKIWCIDWRERKRENNGSCRSWNVNNSVISRIYKIEKSDPSCCEVFNFEVEEDNSYNSHAFTVHNCNEGFGLGTLEAMMTATPIIALKTGGMIRQVVDHRDGSENGIALEPEVRNLVGSQMVPYIYEDHISNETAAKALMQMYEYGPEKRKELGKKAQDYALYEFDLKNTIKDWDSTLTDTMENWRDRRKMWTCQEL